MRTLFRLRLSVAALIIATASVTCKKDSDNSEEKLGNGAVMQATTLKGVVRSTSGAPLSGVSVTTGTLSATTGADGTFAFDRAAITDNRAIIKFAKSGYFTVIRSGVKSAEININAVLQAKGSGATSTKTSFDAAQAQTLTAGGLTVDIPAGAVVKADGSPYSGNVNADVFYLAPDNDDFAELMPGSDLVGIRSGGTEAQLISYGMTEVSLTDASGNALQLASGAESELTFPIPAGMETNPPATIPLWYFDEDKGVWVEEGSATLQGNVYVGTVSHFSWHNLDYPESRVTVKGRVTDCKNNPVPYVTVTAMQTFDNNGYRQGATVTGSDGYYSVWVPANTEITVTVLPEHYDNYSPAVEISIPEKAGNSTIENVNITLPCRDSGNSTVGGDDCGATTSKADVTMLSGGATYRIAFDNDGKRIRFETDDEGEISTIIINSTGEYPELWIYEDGEWTPAMDQEMIESLKLIGYTDAQIAQILETTMSQIAGGFSAYIDFLMLDPGNPPATLAANYAYKGSTVSFAGKTCCIWEATGIDSETGKATTIRIAKWNGVTMFIEVDGVVQWSVQSITLDVPESLFIPE
ncbi:MAG: carboxypeptidase-like regulatory domain-containing protein [Bacteroidales bacterium]|jgi:hypothetical protein|nr:carboxypeptidase-like regulatory domain-containing protein [Bacteroidales bacterium]